ncbi:site-specific DNA-methyltransferase [Stutzerimonas stutzeri]|nr:site-specific DNA-methyltransferase [Stutzerimonas stutzeri]
MNCINQVDRPDSTLFNGDCVEVIAGLPENSVDYSIFSPPFSSLYTYSNSPRDMGNSRTDAEFFEHFDHLVRELARVIKPGHNVSFHCMQLPTSKERDGYIGLKDFRGDLIKAFQKHGFIYASEVCIWKDPVTAMQRTKALGLLHKTIRSNATMSRQGIADYLVTMRKPGEVMDKVAHDDLPVDEWQRLASPVWMDINPNDTLQFRSARDHDDERHICPLQLDVIRRGIRLWTKTGDVVLTPFLGIGSEAFCAVEMGRKAIGVELKKSYFDQAVKNIDSLAAQADMFAIA